MLRVRKFFKPFLICFFFACAQTSHAQELPHFLKGVWRMESKVIYERWDSLSPNSMRGFSYRLKLGHPQVKEYLTLNKTEAGAVYTATVLQQNDGRSVDFTLTQQDSSWIFENPKHDFPKKIVYKRINNDEIEVEVSDGKSRSFIYKMIRMDSEED